MKIAERVEHPDFGLDYGDMGIAPQDSEALRAQLTRLSNLVEASQGVINAQLNPQTDSRMNAMERLESALSALRSSGDI
jgi:hypothetical protein